MLESQILNAVTILILDPQIPKTSKYRTFNLPEFRWLKLSECCIIKERFLYPSMDRYKKYIRLIRAVIFNLKSQRYGKIWRTRFGLVGNISAPQLNYNLVLWIRCMDPVPETLEVF